MWRDIRRRAGFAAGHGLVGACPAAGPCYDPLRADASLPGRATRRGGAWRRDGPGPIRYRSNDGPRHGPEWISESTPAIDVEESRPVRPARGPGAGGARPLGVRVSTASPGGPTSMARRCAHPVRGAVRTRSRSAAAALPRQGSAAGSPGAARHGRSRLPFERVGGGGCASRAGERGLRTAIPYVIPIYDHHARFHRMNPEDKFRGCFIVWKFVCSFARNVVIREWSSSSRSEDLLVRIFTWDQGLYAS